MNTKLSNFLFLVILIFFSACGPIEGNSESSVALPVTMEADNSIIPTESKYDFQSISEIQFLSTATDLISATQIDIPFNQQPVWIAGVPHEDGVAWAVSFEDGSLSAYLVNVDGYKEIGITPQQINSDLPLSIYSANGKLFALAGFSTDVAPFSQPVLYDGDITNIAYISINGDLVLLQDGEEFRLQVDALIDSRILVDEKGNILFLSQPSNRYEHGVLGDKIEAAGITMVSTKPEPKVVQNIPISKPDVIEGIYPIWADLNDDGEREIIVTLSNAQEGARIVAFREDGTLLAEGPLIGTGNRWRHQLIVAPFGDSGDPLLAVVLMPHIGGVIEYYKLNGEILEITKSISGFSSHSYGSRNLFTAQAGDFNNDGNIELLLPDQNHIRLGIVSMENESIKWIELNAELITNLAAVVLTDTKQVVIAVGLSNNSLRIWFD